MELLSCSDGSKATGGGGGGHSPRHLMIWQRRRCALGCVDYGYWTVNTPITIMFSAAHVVYTCGLLSWDPDCSGESPSGRGSNRMDLTPFAQMCLIFVLFLIQKQASSGKKSCVRSVCISYLLEMPLQGQPSVWATWAPVLSRHKESLLPGSGKGLFRPPCWLANQRRTRDDYWSVCQSLLFQ